MSVPSVNQMTAEQSAFLLCDLQTRFRPAIHHFDKVVTTVSKMVQIAKVVGVPMIVTTQNAKALGDTVPEVDLEGMGPLHLGTFDKSMFSMATPEVIELLQRYNIKTVIIMGIEAHICVLMSCLDFLARGFQVHILADGVSSSNKEEIPIAFDRLRQAGVIVSTSESIAFQLQVDSAKPNFKIFAKTIKEEKERTREVLQALLPVKAGL
ncbi:isochorismatase hydrolase [Phanerochaete sordida]|uniref:Isochorismatase hydrolase n=1 Tax=Phanerochaete sordida TaxID=48140 RepID=A0A9P3FYP3_9APHY|nr:isochorismatase hydrolase [Phanerochaete sordida]